MPGDAQNHPLVSAVRKWCLAHPVAIRLFALGLPGLAVGAHVALKSCAVPAMALVARLAPGWALGGPLAAALIALTEDFPYPRARFTEWLFLVGLSIFWLVPVAFATYLILQIRI